MSVRLLLLANDESTIYNFRREVLRAFHSKGYDVILCIPHGKHEKEIEECGCKIINVDVDRHGTNPIHDLKYFLTCRNIIAKYNPDIVLTYTVKPNIYGSIACQFSNTHYINNVTGLGTILQKDSILSKLMLSLQKIAYRRTSCVFFQNEANYKTLLDKGIISAFTSHEILPGSGVNLDLHAFTPMRERDNKTIFIIVSRIRKDKGYDEFFEASEQIKRKHPNTEFHVVGWYEEEYYKQIIDRLVRDGIIIFHGEQIQEEVHKLISQSDCVVLPSYHEGMANVLLEAAACGRAVIATNIPGCREAFDDGVTGYGCEVRNANSLANAMEQYINVPYEKRTEMGKLGRKKMEKYFDRKFVAHKYIKQIEKIIQGQK